MSLAIYIFGVLTVVSVMLSSYFLGERGSHGHDVPYEAGIKSFGSSQVRFFAHYFLLANLFVIFDLESVFLYLWSVSIRDLGWPAFAQMTFFIAMLLLGLGYAIRNGVFNLMPKRVSKS